MTGTKRKKKAKVIAAEQLWSLHWLMALCFLPIFIIGIYIARTELPQGMYRTLVYRFHESMGVLVLILLAARIVVFLRKHLPFTAHRHRRGWVKTVALHASLYLLMLTVPLSGYYMINAAGIDTPFFGLGSLLGFRLPFLIGKNQAIADFTHSLHTWLAYIFLALIVLHALAQRKFLQTTWRRAVKATTVTNPSSSQREG